MNLTALDLKRKVGPLPVGAWLAIIGLGLGAAWVMSRRSSAGAAGSAGPVDSGVPLAPMGDPLAGFVPTGIDALTPLSPVDATPQSNQEWLGKAAKNLTALRRPYAPQEIINALTKLLNGDARSERETLIINDAIAVTGYPPEPVPTPLAPPATPAPVNPTAPGQPGYERTPPSLVSKTQLGRRRTRVLKVGTRGERADEIARRVYGSSVYAPHIRYFNPELLKGKSYTTALPIDVAVAY